MPQSAQKLRLGALVALVVGSMIGGGIFSLPQNMAASAGLPHSPAPQAFRCACAERREAHSVAPLDVQAYRPMANAMMQRWVRPWARSCSTILLSQAALSRSGWQTKPRRS